MVVHPDHPIIKEGFVVKSDNLLVTAAVALLTGEGAPPDELREAGEPPDGVEDAAGGVVFRARKE